MQPSIQQQASQGAQQGQQLVQKWQDQATTAQGQYNDYSSKATQANQDLQKQTSYMQGEGSGENTYNRQIQSQQQAAGWNPQQLSDANKSLFQLTGTLNGANQQFSQPGGVGGYGLSAGALASYEGSILNPLTTGVQNANTQVGVLNNQLQTIQQGASQATTAQVQSEQNVVTALTSAVQSYQKQAESALSNMQFFSDLASKQGGLNAQQQAYYAQAEQAYASAQQALSQSKYLLSQTTGQNIMNQAMQNQLNAPKPAAPKPNGSVTLQAPSNGGITIQGGGSGIQGSAIPIQNGGTGIKLSGSFQGSNSGVKIQ